VEGALSASEEPLLHVELQCRALPIRHVVIRQVLFAELSDARAHPHFGASGTNRHRVREANGARPTLVELNPPGVELSEAHFKRLKEQYDGNNREGLRDPPGESEPPA
jgi:hypothetical protein